MDLLPDLLNNQVGHLLGAQIIGFDQHGVLRRGLRADLALLSADPTACSPDELRALSVKRLWLAGQPATLDAP